MCGIIAVLRRRPGRPAPSADEVLGLVDDAGRILAAERVDANALGAAQGVLDEADRLLRGAPGVELLARDRAVTDTLDERLGALVARLDALDADLDVAGGLGPDELERHSARAVAVRDALWALRNDRLRTAREVAALAGPTAPASALAAYLAVQEALSGLDRLEVRGRDSAGVHVYVRGPGIDLTSPAVIAALAERGADPLFGSGTVRVVDGVVGFVYKAAAEIGELGDNVRAMRAEIAADDLFRRAVSGESAEVVVLGHTRWASVGIISAANAHPLDATEVDRRPGVHVTAALNGDVDNFADLKATHGLRIRPEITTDAKVIPTLVARAIEEGNDIVEAFRRSVEQMEGSIAIAAQIARAPEQLHLALRGSGQALYVGVAEDLFVVASEPYGLVELADRYLRLDGETPADPGNPTGSRGQIVVLDATRAGTVAGIDRRSFDGSGLPVDDGDLAATQITTRDIDRGDFPHYLLKEISESPASFRKTLRGKVVSRGSALRVEIGREALPQTVRDALRSGAIRRVCVIGQGTAAVAGQALALALGRALGENGPMVECLPATELSAFHLRSDLRDTLVVAISQSGTTTDTNRTVDLVRARGAAVLAIVNRRNSDLTDRADGVLYTSDGRDVEMSVASTKAFYAQVAAGFLLAQALAAAVDPARDGTDPATQELLAALLHLPECMEAVLARRAEVAAAARRFAPQRRHWAIVGNGPNRIAAAEVRIKLSELCYKSIAADVTEDKKHIDLSSEPLILVCATGLVGSTADDVAKEVGIYRAHRAAPIVVTSDASVPFPAALAEIRVPDTHPLLAFVLSAMAGHLFGYEAALAIDALAVPLRAARSEIEAAISAGADTDALAGLGRRFEAPAAQFFAGLRAGEHDGQLDASTAARLASLFRYATGVVPLDSYQLEWGKVGTPAVVVEDLTAALTQAIDELTRPVDAIKHQAKTVTVGISRSDETLLETGLVRATLDAGAGRDRLSYETLRTLAALSPLVAECIGYTRYGIESGPAPDDARITVVDRGGIALDLPLRTERDPRLRGTKRLVASEQKVLVGRGRADGRLIVIVPEVKDGGTVGITLLHVRFVDALPVPTLRTALTTYRNRFRAIEAAVTETEPTFRDDLLATVPLDELFTLPVATLADRWRT